MPNETDTRTSYERSRRVDAAKGKSNARLVGSLHRPANRSEYERIANEHNADLNATLENIWELAAKAQAMRDVPNEHERRLYRSNRSS
jgi:hypothetical protein